jgi:hypothetical protein
MIIVRDDAAEPSRGRVANLRRNFERPAGLQKLVEYISKLKEISKEAGAEDSRKYKELDYKKYKIFYVDSNVATGLLTL